MLILRMNSMLVHVKRDQNHKIDFCYLKTSKSWTSDYFISDHHKITFNVSIFPIFAFNSEWFEWYLIRMDGKQIHLRRFQIKEGDVNGRMQHLFNKNACLCVSKAILFLLKTIGWHESNILNYFSLCYKCNWKFQQMDEMDFCNCQSVTIWRNISQITNWTELKWITDH